MYNGVNDENNQGAFNDESSLYHYSYSKDRAPQPGQLSASFWILQNSGMQLA